MTSEGWQQERERLLRSKISELGLHIEGTPLQRIVDRLYREFEQAGLIFKPPVYLSDEWACPDGVPLIGIPFYLADPRLIRIEDEMMDGVEAESDEEILSYLRHEAGHAFTYAYRLYETEEWQRVFGRYDLPYSDEYVPRPFSRSYVRHLPAWYAQKHPDEDFAETFAVWLDPRSNWREEYRAWTAFAKLQYVDRVAKEYGPRQPPVSAADYDAGDELDHTLQAHYQRTQPESSELPNHFDADLIRIFHRNRFASQHDPSSNGSGGAPTGAIEASAVLTAHRRRIVLDVAYWTGLYDVKVRSLVIHLIDRCRALGLRLPPDTEGAALIDFAAFVTTLCMNKLYKGEFVLE